MASPFSFFWPAISLKNGCHVSQAQSMSILIYFSATLVKFPKAATWRTKHKKLNGVSSHLKSFWGQMIGGNHQNPCRHRQQRHHHHQQLQHGCPCSLPDVWSFALYHRANSCLACACGMKNDDQGRDAWREWMVEEIDYEVWNRMNDEWDITGKGQQVERQYKTP